MQFWQGAYLSELPENGVFVFGSNRQGIHGAGAALVAKRRFGAAQGVGVGPTGRSYALPTVDFAGDITLADVQLYWHDFVQYAIAHPEQVFYVTAFGTGLAGFLTNDILNIVQTDPPPDHVLLPPWWEPFLTGSQAH